MDVTGAAKAQFPLDKEDLLRRGRKLVRESVQCGVTSMRAHVEIDELAGFSCLDAGLHLKKEFQLSCHIQIAGPSTRDASLTHRLMSHFVQRLLKKPCLRVRAIQILAITTTY